jgi:glycosyltransferase involved in cell wall biosynthesis
MKLSILIATLPGREHFLRKVKSYLGTHPEVEILEDARPKNIETGKKRNDLIQNCKGEYFCFVDDDDRLTH